MTHPVCGQFEPKKAEAEGLDLASILAEAIRALTVLDAEAVEALAESLEGNLENVALPISSSEWAQLRSRHWVLRHLLTGTGQRLQMLQRISSSPARFANYAAGTLQELSPKSIAGTDIPHRRSSRFAPAS